MLGLVYIEVGGACGRCGREESCVQGVVGVTDRKRPLRRPRFRWEHNIKINLQEMGWEGSAVWIDLAEDRAVLNALLDHRVS